MLKLLKKTSSTLYLHGIIINKLNHKDMHRLCLYDSLLKSTNNLDKDIHQIETELQ